MMEKLGAPQTHLGLKAMIKEVIMRNNEKLTSWAEKCDECDDTYALENKLRMHTIKFLEKYKNTFWSQVDEDDDSAISFWEFLMIFRKARLGELDMESGLGKLATLSEVDVDAVGVGGAKTFFEAKVIDAEIIV